MSDRTKFFLKIMKIELESLEDEIRELEAIYEKKFTDKAISNYVFQENRVTLECEFSCLRSLAPVLDEFPVVTDEDVGTMKQRFLDFMGRKCREQGFPEAVYRFLETKVQKAVLYLT